MFNGFDGGLGISVPAVASAGASVASLNSNPLNWNNIINQGFAIGSQLIGAFGKNPTQQVAYNTSQGIFAIGNTQGQPQYAQVQNPYAGLTTQQIAALQSGQSGIGSSVGSGIDGIFNWLMSNPLITFGGIAGLYLLMREPPRRR